MRVAHYLIYGVLAFLGPGLFGALMGPATQALTAEEGLMLVLVPSGLAWIIFGPLCMAANRWTWKQTAEICLSTMAPGSAWLGMASLGFYAGGGWNWAGLSILIAHFIMMGRFICLGRNSSISTRRLGALWIFGLDGTALLIVGGIACL
jgi:hypothetical protein